MKHDLSEVFTDQKFAQNKRKGDTHLMKRSLSLMMVLGLLCAANAQAFDWFGGRLSLGGGYGYDKTQITLHLPRPIQRSADVDRACELFH